MNADPRAALEALTLAFERHLEACSARRGDDDPAVIAASDALADAFEQELADKVRVLYGGSVKPGNVAEIMAGDDVDGARLRRRDDAVRGARAGHEVGGAGHRPDDVARSAAAAAHLDRHRYFPA